MIKRNSEWQDREQPAHRVCVDVVGGDDSIEYHAAGGGFVHRRTVEDFLARFRPADPRPPVLQRGTFGIDGDGDRVGYTDGRRWNGWEIPGFSREVITSISDELNAEGYYTCGWDGDVLVVSCEDADEPDRLVPVVRETEDGTLTLYYFDGWCWSRVNEGDSEEE